MKRSKTMNVKIKPIVIACALALATSPAMALTDKYLIAKEFVKTLPDGTTVTMWGYAEDVGGACYSTTPIADRLASAACQDPIATAPGPELVIPVGEPDFRIFLTNLLTVPSSIIMTGQERPHSNNVSNGPTWNFGPVGNRTSATQKVRSYGREAGANGGRRAYVWNTFRGTPIANPGGTFTYYSGTEPQKQVYMGLYGAVTKNAAAGEIYPGIAFTNEQILFYSEIDPDHNAAVAAGDPNYTPIAYHPKWFLINGEPYEDGTTPDIAIGNAGVPTLLRFLSAASENHVPVFQGLHGMIHAEDGIQYNWQDGVTGVTTTAPRQQYSVGLPPLMTKDVIVTPALEGRYAVYDGNGYMTNPSDPEVVTAGDTVGGMLRFLNFGPSVANAPPVALPDTLTIEFPEGTMTGVSGVVDVLANDTDPELMPLTITQFDATTPEIGGTVSCLGSECTFTPAGGDPNPYTTGTGTFTYTVSDGPNAVAGVVVTVDVIENMAPTPVTDDVATDTGVVLDFNVLTNDTDPETDTLSIVTLDTAGIVEGSLSCDNGTGACTYTPPAVPSLLPLVETFTYTVEDGINPESAATTVTITVTDPIPAAPVGVNDTYNMVEDGVLDVAAPGVLENDTDANGDALTAVMVSGPTNARPDPNNPGLFLFNLSPDGSFHYEPDVDFNGVDSFTYVVDDGTSISDPTTVTITVDPQNDTPIANNDMLFLQDASLTTLNADGEVIETIFNIAAPGVLDNDVDVDAADTLTAAEVNDPDNVTPELVGTDGAATITVDHAASGIVGSLTYEATDTAAAVSNVAQADFMRLVSVRRSEYNMRQNANPANDDWRIRGSVDASIAPGTQVHVFLVRGGADVAEILPTVTGNNNGQVRNNRNWGINANNVGNAGLLALPGDTLRVEVEGNADAIYLNYPVFIQP
ncbi:MAG: tandem-95 repeat protein [Candidatus Thiodiazotropha sp. (ex Troendleina suluensis)]|nr:tandem-95 repeat protein [Candidatus Thiodiazotropha sp. (ex Troendleina suluensis)]